MKRKIGIVILGIIIVIGGYLIYDQMRFKSDDIILELNDVKVIEYGESFDPLTLIKKCSGEVIYQESIDTTKIGKHKITFVVKENQVTKEFAFEIEVRDTKAPDITLTKEKDSIELGSQLNITQYIKSVKDNADGDLTYKKDKDVKSGDVGFYTYHSQVDTQKNGKYIVTIIAIDKSGNKAKKELAITVQKKKETIYVIEADRGKIVDSFQDELSYIQDMYYKDGKLYLLGRYQNIKEKEIVKRKR